MARALGSSAARGKGRADKGTGAVSKYKTTSSAPRIRNPPGLHVAVEKKSSEPHQQTHGARVPADTGTCHEAMARSAMKLGHFCWKNSFPVGYFAVNVDPSCCTQISVPVPRAISSPRCLRPPETGAAMGDAVDGVAVVKCSALPGTGCASSTSSTPPRDPNLPKRKQLKKKGDGDKALQDSLLPKERALPR